MTWPAACNCPLFRPSSSKALIPPNTSMRGSLALEWAGLSNRLGASPRQEQASATRPVAQHQTISPASLGTAPDPAAAVLLIVAICSRGFDIPAALISLRDDGTSTTPCPGPHNHSDAPIFRDLVYPEWPQVLQTQLLWNFRQLP